MTTFDVKLIVNMALKVQKQPEDKINFLRKYRTMILLNIFMLITH